MFYRINIYNIVTDHLKTLRHTSSVNSKNIYWKDFILFFVIPVTIAGILTYMGYTLANKINELITAVSILGGFLFNLLAIIYGQIDKIKGDTTRTTNDTDLQQVKKIFVKEIHINISFCIVLSIVILLALFLLQVDIPDFKYRYIINKLLIFISYFLLSIFLLSLLMVINRIYILLKKDSEY